MGWTFIGRLPVGWVYQIPVLQIKTMDFKARKFFTSCQFTSNDWFSSEGKTMMLGTLMNRDRRSRRNPPKNGTTLQSGISSERLTASRYSSVSSRDIRAPHNQLKVERSSSTIDSQNGFNLSDLTESIFWWLKIHACVEISIELYMICFCNI